MESPTVQFEYLSLVKKHCPHAMPYQATIGRNGGLRVSTSVHTAMTTSAFFNYIKEELVKGIAEGPLARRIFSQKLTAPELLVPPDEFLFACEEFGIAITDLRPKEKEDPNEDAIRELCKTYLFFMDENQEGGWQRGNFCYKIKEKQVSYNSMEKILVNAEVPFGKLGKRVLLVKVIFERAFPPGPLTEDFKEFDVSTIDYTKKIVPKVFNCYQPSDWEKIAGLEEVVGKIPEEVTTLVNHLLPIELERDYFYAWVYKSLFERAPTFLILHGMGGTGKTTLKNILFGLHGPHNCTTPGKSILDKEFNSILFKTTLVALDELEYTEKNESKMKEWINDRISIEGKGVDATRQTKLAASYMIINNKKKDNYISPEARKFAPLKIVDKRLEDVLSKQEVEKILKLSDYEKHTEVEHLKLAQFASWLKHFGPDLVKKFPNMEYKGPMFYELVVSSLYVWQRILTLAFIDKTDWAKKIFEIIYYRDLGGYYWPDFSPVFFKAYRKQFNVVSPNPFTAQEFVRAMIDPEGNRMFHVTKEFEGEKDFGQFYFRLKNDNRSMQQIADCEGWQTKEYVGLDRKTAIPISEFLEGLDI